MVKAWAKDVGCVVSGLIFGVAWWIMIDAQVISSLRKEQPPIIGWYWVPGILSTLGFIMMNIVDLSSMNPYSWWYDENVSGKVRAWLFFAFIIHFSNIGGAMYIMIDRFLPPHNLGDPWPGIAICLQNFLLFFAGLLMLWVGTERAKGDDYEEI